MERSEYQEFMDCYNLFEAITRAAISAVVICEWLQKHDPGTMATERDTQEMAHEVDNAPNAKACAERDNQRLQNTNCGIKKCHIFSSLSAAVRL